MAEDNTSETAPEALSNSDRLLLHLKQDSLAVRLVHAQRETTDAAKALKAVLTERLEQVRKDLGGDED